MKSHIGKESSSWTILNQEPIIRNNKKYVLCRCFCGVEKEVILKNIKSGVSKSCGCIGRQKTKERNQTHGKRFTRTWRIWRAMKTRCYNKNIPQYKNYGGRGVTVCDEWRNDFSAFYDFFGDIPEGLSIDRINTDGNYEPNNVRLATAKQQCQNKTNNHKINGVCITEISKQLGGRQALVGKRLRRGWDIERAITEKSHASIQNWIH